MKPFSAEQRSKSRPAATPMFTPLSGVEPIRLVCAALVLALLAVLFRIASIW
jgi:hypothetical protein